MPCSPSSHDTEPTVIDVDTQPSLTPHLSAACLVIDVDEQASLAPSTSDLLATQKIITSSRRPKRCPGYRLMFSNQKSALTQYPTGFHDKQPVPWTMHVDGANVTLYSTNCSQAARQSATGNSLACSSCENLDRHAIIMGIRHRALDGAHENTPWAFLSVADTDGQLASSDEGDGDLDDSESETDGQVSDHSNTDTPAHFTATGRPVRVSARKRQIIAPQSACGACDLSISSDEDALTCPACLDTVRDCEYSTGFSRLIAFA
jgi:hypothetical protein